MRFEKRALCILALMPLGCGAATPASELAQAPELELEGQTKCSIAASQSRPLIVEWPSTDRGDLEAAAKKGVVAVRYSGCEMEVLRRCVVEGRYSYTPFTRKDDRISIRDADELYANVPIGAVNLEGKLERAGQLTVNMTVVGKLEARLPIDHHALVGECAAATHLVTGVTVGAFDFYAGADAEVGGGIDVMGAGAGAKSVAARELLNRDGSREKCAAASGQDEHPPDGCGAFLRLEVTPLSEVGSGAPTRSAARDSATKGGTSVTGGPAPSVAALLPPGAVAAPHGTSWVTFALDGGRRLHLYDRGRWTAQNLVVKGAPALAANRSGRLTAIAVDGSGAPRLRVARTWAGAGSWDRLPGTTSLEGGVALVPTSKDVLAAFVRSSQGRLLHSWQTKPGGDQWSSWLDLGGTLATDPVALTDGGGRLTVVASTPGGEIQLIAQERAYGPWGDWMSLGSADGPPAAVATTDGLAVLALRNGALMRSDRSGLGAWREWQPIVTQPDLEEGAVVFAAPFDGRAILVIQEASGLLRWGAHDPSAKPDAPLRLETLPGRFARRPHLASSVDGVEIVVAADDGVKLGRIGRGGFAGWRKLPGL